MNYNARFSEMTDCDEEGVSGARCFEGNDGVTGAHSDDDNKIEVAQQLGMSSKCYKSTQILINLNDTQ